MVSRLHMATHNTRHGAHRAVVTNIRLLPMGMATTANMVTAIRRRLLRQPMATNILAIRQHLLRQLMAPPIPAIRLRCPLPMKAILLRLLQALRMRAILLRLLQALRMRAILLRLLQALPLQTLPDSTPRGRSMMSSSGESAKYTSSSYGRIISVTSAMTARSPETREFNRNSLVLKSLFLPLPVQLLNSLHLKSPLWLRSLLMLLKSLLRLLNSPLRKLECATLHRSLPTPFPRRTTAPAFHQASG
jgi:hypothetical protein